MSTGRRASRRGFRNPTRRDYLIFYGLGAIGVVTLGGVTAALDWSSFAFRLGVLAWVAVYVPLAVAWLRGRAARPSAST